MIDTACKRCGRPALGGDGNPDARMLRRARTGVCVDCGVVQFLQRVANTNVLGTVDRALPDGLRLPHVQEQFAKMMVAGGSDARPDEIDWERVIAVWDIAPRATGTLF